MSTNISKYFYKNETFQPFNGTLISYLPIDLNVQQLIPVAQWYTEVNTSWSTVNVSNVSVYAKRNQMPCMYDRDSFNLTMNNTYVMLAWFESFHCDYTQLPALNNSNLTLYN